MCRTIFSPVFHSKGLRLSARSSKGSRTDLSPADQIKRDQIDPANLPKHVAIIMDGNGRWARQRKLTRIKGHKAAIPAVQETVEACAELGIRHLTLYAFSTENWKRPEQETGTLMALLRQYLRIASKSVKRHNLRVNAIGAISELSTGIQRDLKQVIARSRANTGMLFNIALNYSGRGDIMQAFRAATAAGENPANLSEETFVKYLSTAGQPDPDLVIRTSGEMRISNFLLWQIAYSEIWVTSTLWPDFRRSHLYDGILAYQQRHRRFGGI